jgi:cellulose synthase/poly-beta-1,6-N-acetylglucosamine synthase-like glycosyltransferase
MRAPTRLERGVRQSRWWLALLAVEVVPVGLVVLGLAVSDALGVATASVCAVLVTVALTATAVVTIAEVIASRAPSAPPHPGGPAPPATAIVAAYLPNEHQHIVLTLQRLLTLPYPGRFQVICVYNTPRSLPVEHRLEHLARRHPRLRVIQVEESESKAANVNAALAEATGEIIGIFDADHHPEAGGFERAWRWLAAGYDVVQGRCRVRDGQRSRLARIVAAEFDAMYTVTHPGRARVQGFAIFGGSNGYWRADALRATLLDPEMLTEDIDASIRGLTDGARFAVDPAITSTELAPTSPRALWNQRLRWAQGWTQVARQRVGTALASPHATGRARAGLIWLLGCCEALPWISTLGLGVIAHDTIRAELRWNTVTAALVAFHLAIGPLHALTARRRVPPSQRHPASWYLLYAATSAFAYVELLNAAKRLGQLRELSGRRTWIVTPRPRVEPLPEAA